MRLKTLSFLPLLFILVIGCRPAPTVSAVDPYLSPLKASMKTLLADRDTITGTWESAGWWNSANVLTTVIRYSAVMKDTTMYPIIEDVYNKAKVVHASTAPGSKIISVNFINDYYDDEAWWALAWIDAYHLTHQGKYLAMAKLLFTDLLTGWSDKYNGGIYWKKNPLAYKNSIANNLFSLTAIRLYKATKEATYKEWFEKSVAWYLQSGLINTDTYYIEDGLCSEGTPNRERHYTYNQGVALAVFAEHYLLTKDKHSLELAEKIAKATFTPTFTTSNGVLKERLPKIAKGNDGVQFKGIFMRHLAFLYRVTNNVVYKDFILKNANSLVTAAYNTTNHSFSCYWSAPSEQPRCAATSAALDCVIEAEWLQQK